MDRVRGALGHMGPVGRRQGWFKVGSLSCSSEAGSFDFSKCGR